MRGGCGDVDCVRESFESATGAAGRPAKGNGDAGGVRRGPSPVAAADADRERRALLLRRGAWPGPRGRLGTRAIAHLDAFNIPLLASVRLDGEALGFTLLAAVITGVLFGLLPALRVRTFAVANALKDGQPRVERRPEPCLGSQRAGGFRDSRLPAPY